MNSPVIQDERQSVKGARVSVIVPAFNAQKTLAATLESAVAQGEEVEIIVVDDGSKDDTLHVARTFEPRVTVLTGANGGVSEARNRGIEASHGDWLTFLDSDDLLAPGTLRTRLACAQACASDVVVCDWITISESGTPSDPGTPHKSVDWALLRENAEVATAAYIWATTAAIMYSRDIVRSIGGFRRDLPVIQDARFLFDAAYNGATFAHSPHVGAMYRIVAESLSRLSPVRFNLDVLRNGEQIEQLWRGRGALQPSEQKALRDIFEGAAGSLFRHGNANWHLAMDAAIRSGAPLRRYIRTASLLSTLLGETAARQIMAAAIRWRNR